MCILTAKLDAYKPNACFWFLLPALSLVDWLKFAYGTREVVKPNIAKGVISITAIAFGTSLPELLVSVKAARMGKSELAVGNVFGSNAFNALMVVGIPGLFSTLTLDTATLSFGIPAMAIVTLIFIISGISRTIYHWEGMMFLMLYFLFILKFVGLV